MDIARQFGATHTLLAEADVEKKIRALTGDRGADYVFEAIGLTQVQERAMQAVRPGGALVGVASSVHILNAYQLGLKEGLDWNKALGRAYGTAGFPVVLALTTTLAGLLSLTSVPLAPMRAFGLYASLGVFLALVGTIFLLPVLMSFWFKRTPPKSGSARGAALGS